MATGKEDVRVTPPTEKKAEPATQRSAEDRESPSPGQDTTDLRASLPPSLLKALEMRDAVYGDRRTAERPSGAVAAPAATADSTAELTPHPASRPPSSAEAGADSPDRSGSADGDLEEQVRALRKRLEDEQVRSARLQSVIDQRDKQIKGLESQLAAKPAVASAPAASGGASSSDLEAKMQALALAHEKQRRQDATEIAALTKQLSELRQRYESRIAALNQQIAQLRTGGGRAAGAVEGEPAERPRPLGGETPAGQQPQKPGRLVLISNMDQDLGPPTLVTLDDGEIGEELVRRVAKYGHPCVCPPAECDLEEELSQRKVALLAVNLASPRTWRLARVLAKSATAQKMPIVGYALPNINSPGLWFGMLNFVTLPLEDAALTDAMKRLAPNIKQTILVGQAGDVFSELRKQLIRLRMPTQIASDRRQIPDVIRAGVGTSVVYPASGPVDAFRVLATLREDWTFKDAPSLFVLDEVPQPREEELLTAGVRTTLRMGRMRFDELITQLTNIFSVSKSGSLRFGRR